MLVFQRNIICSYLLVRNNKMVPDGVPADLSAIGLSDRKL